MTPITGLHRILPKCLQVTSAITFVPRHLGDVPPPLYLYQVSNCAALWAKGFPLAVSFSQCWINILSLKNLNSVLSSSPFGINHLRVNLQLPCHGETTSHLSRLCYNYISSVLTLPELATGRSPCKSESRCFLLCFLLHEEGVCPVGETHGEHGKFVLLKSHKAEETGENSLHASSRVGAEVCFWHHLVPTAPGRILLGSCPCCYTYWGMTVLYGASTQALRLENTEFVQMDHSTVLSWRRLAGVSGTFDQVRWKNGSWQFDMLFPWGCVQHPCFSFPCHALLF